MPQKLRIVSLIASATEIVCALGFEDQLVARSHECDYPETVKRLPSVTKTKFDPDGRSYEIDQRVKAIVQEALSVYQVDAKLLEKLQPTHIVTQTQCEVCAVSLKDVEDAVCRFAQKNIQIVSLEPNSLGDVWQDILRVAHAFGVQRKGEELVKGLQARMEVVEEKAKKIDECPRVACIEWIDPLMAAGNWMPELVEMAGGENLFGEAGKHSPWMSWDDLLRLDPDIILVLPCGFDIKKTLTEMDLLTSKPGWKNLKAIKEKRVFVLDGNQYFNRPGPRLAESLEILAEIFHPELFHFGHEEKGWISFQPLQG